MNPEENKPTLVGLIGQKDDSSLFACQIQEYNDPEGIDTNNYLRMGTVYLPISPQTLEKTVVYVLPKHANALNEKRNGQLITENFEVHLGTDITDLAERVAKGEIPPDSVPAALQNDALYRALLKFNKTWYSKPRP